MGDIPAHSITGTKLADGSVFFELVMGTGPAAVTVAQFNMPAADVATMDTVVGAGATDTTRTFTYTGKTASALKGGKLNHYHNSW